MSKSQITHTEFGSVVLAEPVSLPDVLDVFVAGGGPAGTAAAVRAKEFGLTALVIDYDDLMKRIRDYPKERLILPSYGGGDKMSFPDGGAMLEALRFEDSDKDDLVAHWRGLYRDLSIPARIGSELNGLELGQDGIWDVLTWNHRAAAEMRYRARNVVIAIGAGVPRRFDIPGDTDGIAFRLEDPRDFVDGPALVIGEGTAAAEAVIAVSQAKVEAEEKTAVYWSYRGERMPKVSKALGDVFFDAYVGNGNIRYLPLSDASAVVTGPDRREYLSVHVDRKIIDGRPAESVQLEFPKDQVVACIGEDLPVKLLQRLGVKTPLIKDQPRMVVSVCGETNLPGVFLVGDARGPRYMRCEDFEDSNTYEQISQKRNIKAAMIDAGGVVEEIAARMNVAPQPDEAVPGPPLGSEVTQVPGAVPSPQATPSVEANPDLEETLKPAASASRPSDSEITPLPTATPVVAESAPLEIHEEVRTIIAPVATHTARSKADAAGAVLFTLQPDGSVEEEFPISRDMIEIGRKGADIACPEDVHMDDVHARLEKDGESYWLVDADSSSGVWLRVDARNGRLLRDQDQVWLGRQILVLEAIGRTWGLAHYGREGELAGTYQVGERGIFVGRGEALVLDAEDASLSRRHAQFVKDGDTVRVIDRGSRNGTYVKSVGSVALDNGDEFRVAGSRFRIETTAAVAPVPGDDVIIDPPRLEPEGEAARAAIAEVVLPKEPTPVPVFQQPTPPATVGAAAAPAAVAGAPFVQFEHEEFPASFSVGDSQTVLEAFMESGGKPDEPLSWECKKGLCGLCCVEILEGAEEFEPYDPGSSEMKTIETAVMVEPDPSKYRLTCIAKIRGPVKLGLPQ